MKCIDLLPTIFIIPGSALHRIVLAVFPARDDLLPLSFQDQTGNRPAGICRRIFLQ